LRLDTIRPKHYLTKDEANFVGSQKASLFWGSVCHGHLITELQISHVLFTEQKKHVSLAA
jgi:hypothetical protein